jgi:hypothetical protein
MPTAVDENDEDVEGLWGERDRLSAAEQQPLPGCQNEVAKFKNPVFVHRASLGNFQEKFKTFPRTLPLQRHCLTSGSTIGSLEYQAADGPGERNMNLHANQVDYRSRVAGRSVACAMLLLISLMIKPTRDSAERAAGKVRFRTICGQPGNQFAFGNEGFKSLQFGFEIGHGAPQINGERSRLRLRITSRRTSLSGRTIFFSTRLN